MSKDDIGERGECLFQLLMTDFCGRSEPYFRPRFLGAKFPTFDFIVELVDQPHWYFFVQVKTTSTGYTKAAPRRLKVQVSQTDVKRMAACPAPAYVIGIDTVNEAGFLLSVNEARSRISSLPTRFILNCEVLAELADEVRNFWADRDMTLTDSKFRE